MDKESTQDWDIRLTYSHVMRLCFNFFLKNFPNPQPPAASSASFHRNERVFEAKSVFKVFEPNSSKFLITYNRPPVL